MQESPLQRLIKRAEDLLQVPFERLAPILLKLASEQQQHAGFVPSAVSDVVVNDGYPGFKEGEVETHLARAWNWIERKGLIEASAGLNGRNGWRMFTPDGEAIAKGASFETIRAAQESRECSSIPTLSISAKTYSGPGTTPRRPREVSGLCVIAFEPLQAMRKGLKHSERAKPSHQRRDCPECGSELQRGSPIPDYVRRHVSQ